MVSIVTNAGKASITAAWHDYANRARFFGWGVGSGQGAADNNLADATGTTEARTEGTSFVETADVTHDTYRVVGTITAAGDRAITEVGVFDDAGSGAPPSGGNLCMYGDFAEISLAAADQITFTVNVQFQ